MNGLNLDGGWRMPTMDKLTGVYKGGAGVRNMTLLLKTTGLWVWSGRTKSSSGRGALDLAVAAFFDWRSRDSSRTGRAFAVHSRGRKNIETNISPHFEEGIQNDGQFSHLSS